MAQNPEGSGPLVVIGCCSEENLIMEERAKKIIEACLLEESKNPIDIFKHIAHMDCVRIHGTEQHYL